MPSTRIRSTGNVPRKGDYVYAGTELGNGRVIDIDYPLQQVIIKYQGGEVESEDFEIFFGTWTDSFGGCWWIED